MTTGVLWFLDSAIALVLLIGLALCGVAIPLTVFRMARTTGQKQVRLRAALQRHVVESIGGMEEALALGIEPSRLNEHDRMTNELTRLQGRQARIGALHHFTGAVFTWAAVVCALLLSIPKIQTGEFSEVILAAVVFGLLASFEAVQPLSAAYQYLEQAQQARRSPTRGFVIDPG